MSVRTSLAVADVSESSLIALRLIYDVPVRAGWPARAGEPVRSEWCKPVQADLSVLSGVSRCRRTCPF